MVKVPLLGLFPVPHFLSGFSTVLLVVLGGYPRECGDVLCIDVVNVFEKSDGFGLKIVVSVGVVDDDGDGLSFEFVMDFFDMLDEIVLWFEILFGVDGASSSIEVGGLFLESLNNLMGAPVLLVAARGFFTTIHCIVN